MRKSVFVLLVLFVVAATPASASLLISTVDNGGSLAVGADPFFWANTQLAAAGDTNSAEVPVACGSECAEYGLTDLTLGVAGTYFFPAANPLLTITYNSSGDSSYQLSGLIDVSTYVVQFDLDLALPMGTLDAASLTAPPSFPITSIDAANSLFIYGIVSGAPPTVGEIALSSGSAAAEITTPEPGSLFLVLGALAALLGRGVMRERPTRP